MIQQLDTHSIKLLKGMNQDQGIQLANSQTAYKLVNIKNQIVGTALLDSLMNEKGTRRVSNIVYKNPQFNTQDILKTFDIITVFKCTPQISVIFLKYVDNQEDAIIKVHQETASSYIEISLLAKGEFNFGDSIDAVYCYENSEIQKVYWVDGVNVLRYININIEEQDCITDSFYLDSTPKIRYDHLIKVTKNYNQGLFSAGVIQYAFTYYIKNGPETPIVDYTPLYYITNETRGLREDEVTNCSFNVKVINPDTRFDYIRIYAIQRTSLDATPIVRIVKDVKIRKDE